MKALTLYQPWASLVAARAKRNETRSWGTRYRGPLAIHAGMKKMDRVWSVDELERAGLASGNLPFGAIVCIAKLIDCVPAARVRASVSSTELNFGNYSDGRWVWILEVTEAFATPVPARGRQGLWEWDPLSTVGKKPARVEAQGVLDLGVCVAGEGMP